MCREDLGIFSRYNSLSDTCECSSGYELSQSLLGGYSCQSCFSKYGSHSSYNYLIKSCECDDGYTFKEGKCVEKQNNAYFLLKELNTDDKMAIIKSDYTGTYYLIKYGLGCYDSTFSRYLNNFVVVNMGTDFYVDTYDYIVLYNDNETCDITSVKTVNSSYTLFEDGTEPKQIFSYINPIITNNTVNSITNTDEQKDYIFKQRQLIGTIDNSLSNRLKGKILLQVEDNGEGWYVNPDTRKRSYLGTREDAFRVMREFGLGISENDFNTLKEKAPQRLAGRIVLRVEAHGEGYYVNPDDLKMYYMPTPEDAFQIMRNLGLGIANNDIYKIDIE